jgi:hypothetical protein
VLIRCKLHDHGPFAPEENRMVVPAEKVESWYFGNERGVRV